MTRWCKWKDKNSVPENVRVYGDGPFILLGMTDEHYTVLLPMNIAREVLEEDTQDRSVWLERAIKQAIGEGGCKGSCKGSCNDEPHPLAGLKVTYNRDYVSESPYTKKFKIGQKVYTPSGSGNVERITWRQVQVNGVLFDAVHVTPCP